MFLASCQHVPDNAGSASSADGRDLSHFVGPMEFLWLYGCTLWWNSLESLTLDRLAERMSSWYLPRAGVTSAPEPVT